MFQNFVKFSDIPYKILVNGSKIAQYFAIIIIVIINKNPRLPPDPALIKGQPIEGLYKKN